nr:hypothetical protein CFP56_73795 [Quercus suber]
MLLHHDHTWNKLRWNLKHTRSATSSGAMAASGRPYRVRARYNTTGLARTPASRYAVAAMLSNLWAAGDWPR